MRTLIYSLSAAFIFLISSANLFAQMPPHPSLIEKLKKGEIQKPYTLKHLHELRNNGIDASWDSGINKFL